LLDAACLTTSLSIPIFVSCAPAKAIRRRARGGLASLHPTVAGRLREAQDLPHRTTAASTSGPIVQNAERLRRTPRRAPSLRTIHLARRLPGPMVFPQLERARYRSRPASVSPV